MSNFDIDQFSADAVLALRSGIKFGVATKSGRGQKWTYINPELTDLDSAMKAAESVDAYEVAIFAITDTGGGIFYWSSRFPNILNSTVIDPSIGISPPRINRQ